MSPQEQAAPAVTPGWSLVVDERGVDQLASLESAIALLPQTHRVSGNQELTLQRLSER